MSRRANVKSSMVGKIANKRREGAAAMNRTRRQFRAANSARTNISLLAKETGYVDKSATTYACDTTGTIALLNTIAQGAGTTQRVGKRIKLKGIYFRGLGYSGSTTAVADTSLILVYDRRPTGLLPAITDILTAANTTAFTNDVNLDRFRILRRWDQVFTGNRTTAGQQTALTAQNFDEYVDLKMLPQVFGAAGTGAIGDITEGALYLVSVGNQAPGTTAPEYSIANRVRFVDV